MNKHIFVDKLTARIGSLVAGNKKFFSRSIESESFETLINSITVSIPEISGEGTIELSADSSEGQVAVAFRIEKWMGPDYPTLIYHHGNNERPFDYRKGAKNTFLGIFVKEKDAFNTNLIVVRAPYHDCPLKEYQEKMTELKKFMNMIATSVKVNEALIQSLPEGQPVMTCGISLGGWVTNLHRSFYNTSDIYIPLVAGSFLGELFLQSSYTKLTGSNALLYPERIRKMLNFNNAFSKIATLNVYPLMARFDQFIEYEVQKKSYNGLAVRTIETGHVTAAVNPTELRAHVLNIMEKTGINSKNK